MTYIIIDCETAATDRVVPDDFVKIDARLKDPDKISAAIDKWHDKTSLDGSWGEIISVAYAINNHAPKVFYRGAETREEDMLVDFLTAVEGDLNALDVSAHPTVVGHNVAFDLGFLFKRLAIHRIQYPYWLSWPVSFKSPVHDTQTMWVGAREYISLDALGYILLGRRKTMSGGDVAQLWLDGEYERIGEYNIEDVEMTRAVHKIMLSGDYPDY